MLYFFKRKTVSKLEENVLLENEIYHVAKNPNTSRENLYQAILDATLIVAIRQPTYKELGYNQKYVMEEKEKFWFYTIFYDGAKQALPVFTREEYIEIWRKEQYYIKIKGKDLFSMVSNIELDAVIINYLAPLGGFLYSWEVKKLAEGKLPIEFNRKIDLKEGTKIFYGKPSTPPSQSLIKGIQNILYKSHGISSAYIFEIYIEDSNDLTHLALGLVLDTTPDKAIEPIFYQIDSVIRSCSKENEFVDIVPLVDKNLIEYLLIYVDAIFRI